MSHLYKIISFLSLIFVLLASQNAFAEDTNEHLRGTDPGLVLKLGAGYATVAAAGLAPVIGYKFNRYFELDAETTVRVSKDRPYYGVDIALTPRATFHNSVGNFFLGLGLGFDLYHSKANPSAKFPSDIITTRAFLIKPTMGFELYPTESFHLGFTWSVPVYIGHTKTEKTRYYDLHFPDGSSDNRAFSFTTDNDKDYGARFEFLFFVGWKFSVKQ